MTLRPTSVEYDIVAATLELNMDWEKLCMQSALRVCFVPSVLTWLDFVIDQRLTASFGAAVCLNDYFLTLSL
jgi:hypothetical protein